jgi:hypothetical protein
MNERIERLRKAIEEHVFDTFKQTMLLRDLDALEDYILQLTLKEYEIDDKLLGI